MTLIRIPLMSDFVKIREASPGFKHADGQHMLLSVLCWWLRY